MLGGTEWPRVEGCLAKVHTEHGPVIVPLAGPMAQSWVHHLISIGNTHQDPCHKLLFPLVLLI